MVVAVAMAVVVAMVAAKAVVAIKGQDNEWHWQSFAPDDLW